MTQNRINNVNRTAGNRGILSVFLLIITLCMICCSCSSKKENNTDIVVDTEKRDDDSKSINDNESRLTVDFMNVGKGDCTIITFKDKIYMIDTGYEETAGSIIEYLEKIKADKIDIMIITHFDKDHVGGATQIMDSLKVDKIYMPDYEGEGNKYKKFIKYLDKNNLNDRVTKVTEDMEWRDENIDIKIFAPKEDNYELENNYSLVTKLTYNEDTFMFAGDVQEVRIDELLGNPEMAADVLKIPYHGRLEKNNIQYIDEVNPQYAIITSDTIEDVSTSIQYELERLGTRYYFNCEGDIHIDSYGTGVLSISQATESE